MAFKIIWSQQARDDLRDIVTFIAEHDRSAAEAFGYRLMAKVDVLAQFPQPGSAVKIERHANFRQIVLPPYRIIYRVQLENNLIAISRIWHGARGEPEIPNHFEL